MRFIVNKAKNAAYELGTKLLHRKILEKFSNDSRHLPLQKVDFELYKKIHIYYYIKLFTFPNLLKPRSFNEKMQWLKLFDQSKDIISCSDKLAVKEYVNSKVGRRYYPETIKLFDKVIYPKDIDDELIYKCNHDSGSVFFGVENKTTLCKNLNKAVNLTFSDNSGEWAYKYIEPMIFSEQVIPGFSGAKRPPDYKFFCTNGCVNFCHLIYDRETGFPKEVLLDIQQNDIKVPLYPSFSYGKYKKIGKNWNEMIELAEALSESFKFVRVDLYFNDDQIYVGEMTFWPQSGTYRGAGQKYYGDLINFDMTPKRVKYT
jgi:hypothetical protein